MEKTEFKIEPKGKLNQVKVLLGMELKLAQMKAEDGVTIFEAEQFAPDYSVGIVQEEGIVPAPVGSYTLEDGSVMIVEVEGVILSIGMPEAEEETVMDESGTDAAPAAKKVVESVTKETFFALQESTKELISEHEVALSKIETLENEKKELEVKLAKAEEVKPIVHNPEKNKVKFEDMTPVEKFRYLKNQ